MGSPGLSALRCSGHETLDYKDIGFRLFIIQPWLTPCLRGRGEMAVGQVQGTMGFWEGPTTPEQNDLRSHFLIAGFLKDILTARNCQVTLGSTYIFLHSSHFYSKINFEKHNFYICFAYCLCVACLRGVLSV